MREIDQLDQLLEDLAGNLVVLKAYFDESISGDKKLLAIGGFLFDRTHARRLNRQWKLILKDYNLDFFHMCDCANGAPPYDAMERGRRDRLARRLINAIHSHAELQIAVSVNVEEFIASSRKASIETGMDFLNAFGGPYTWAAQACMESVAQWCKERAYNGPITYFFEQGNAFQTEADRFLNMIPFDKEVRTKYRYYTHVFVPKETEHGNRLVQAADILAWEWMRDRSEQIEKISVRPRRLSLTFLLKHRLAAVRHWRDTELQASFGDTFRHNLNTQGPQGWKPYDESGFQSRAELVLALKSLPPAEPPPWFATAYYGRRYPTDTPPRLQ